jgi:hypothetical protein
MRVKVDLMIRVPGTIRQLDVPVAVRWPEHRNRVDPVSVPVTSKRDITL